MKRTHLFYSIIFVIVIVVIFGLELLTNIIPHLKNNYRSDPAFFGFIVIGIPLIIFGVFKFVNINEQKKSSSKLLNLLKNNVLAITITIGFLIFLLFKFITS